MSSLWDLDEDAGQIDRASSRWASLGTALTDSSEAVDTGSRRVRAADWEGKTADSYDQHRKKLMTDLDAAAELADQIASVLSRSAGSVRIAQGRLDQSWATVVGIPQSRGIGGEVIFQPSSPEESKQVDDAISAANDIRRGLDSELATDRDALDAATAKWQEIARVWQTVAEGTVDAFDLPAGAQGTGIITSGDQTVISTGDGDDEVTVFIDPNTGEQIVVVKNSSGETVYRVPAGQELIVRGGGGNDRIGVPKGVDLDVTLIGGEGNDAIHGGDGDDSVYGLDGHDYVDAGAGSDRVSGGADRDYVDGQTGDDRLYGGEGNDSIYGLDGNDVVVGENGNDFLEGGAGNDRIIGGSGRDTLSGGSGDDRIAGGGDDDVAYAGTGSDKIAGGSGDDTAYAESGDTGTGTEKTVKVQIDEIPEFIKIEGSPEFQARVRADLELLAASPRGQQMLADFQRTYDDSGFLGFNKQGLTIAEYADNSNSTAEPSGERINYSPRIDWIEEGPPVVVLFHEMAHAYDFRHDQFDRTPYSGDDTANHGVDQGERVAVGLPIDHDNDPSTPERIDPDHSYDLTENGLREEMGAPNRPHY